MNETTKELNQILDYDKLISEAEESKKYAERIKNKKIIIFLGTTGAGKSTTINYLRGKSLKKLEIEYKDVIDLEDNKENDCKIGHK